MATQESVSREGDTGVAFIGRKYYLAISRFWRYVEGLIDGQQCSSWLMYSLSPSFPKDRAVERERAILPPVSKAVNSSSELHYILQYLIRKTVGRGTRQSSARCPMLHLVCSRGGRYVSSTLLHQTNTVESNLGSPMFPETGDLVLCSLHCTRNVFSLPVG